MLRTRSPRKEKISNCYLHSNSLSNKMDNSLLAVRDINHKYIVVESILHMIGGIGDLEIGIALIVLSLLIWFASFKYSMSAMKKKEF